jgi:S-adenosylmethionine decarboxylase
MELKIAGFGNPELLNDAQHLRAFSAGLAQAIGMTIVNGPTVISFKELTGDPEAGLSCFTVIAESHIALHTWPEKGYLYLEVDSCKPFEVYRAGDIFKESFGITRVFRCRIDEDNWAPAEAEVLNAEG